MGVSLGYNAPINAGVYWIEVKATNKTDPSDVVTATMKFTINKADITASVQVTEITEPNKTLADASLEGTAQTQGGNNVSGQFYFVDDSGNVLDDSTIVVEAGVYKWKFVPTDSNNYNGTEGTIIIWHKYDTVTLLVDDQSHGSVTGAGDFDVNMPVTVKATPKSGYEFAYWTKNGIIVSYDAEYTFVLTGDIELVAVFEEIDVVDFSDIVNYMWIFAYVLAGVAVLSVIGVFVRRKEE